MKEFVADIVKNADIDSGHVRVGLLVYSTDVSIQFHLRRFKRKVDVLDAIKRVPYRPGDTNTAGALRALWSQMFTNYYGDRTDAHNIAILITDGISNINSYRTEIEANTAKSRAVHIYAVGIGLEDTREINAIASDPSSKNVFTVDNFQELRQLIGEGVLRKICLGKFNSSVNESGDWVQIVYQQGSMYYFYCKIRFWCAGARTFFRMGDLVCNLQ